MVRPHRLAAAAEPRVEAAAATFRAGDESQGDPSERPIFVVGLPRTGKQAGGWKVPDALVMLLVLLVTLLPFSVYLFHEIPDS